MGFEIIGLREVRQGMYKISNVMGSPRINDVVWNMGVVAREHIRAMCTVVVYNSPPSPNYKRTGFLREGIYLSMTTVTGSNRSDRAERLSAGRALAAAVYPRRNINKVYAFASTPPHRSKRSVRVISGARYSDYVEYGNGRVGPRPFMRSGLDAGYRDILSYTEREIHDIVSRVSQAGALITRRSGR